MATRLPPGDLFISFEEVQNELILGDILRAVFDDWGIFWKFWESEGQTKYDE